MEQDLDVLEEVNTEETIHPLIPLAVIGAVCVGTYFGVKYFYRKWQDKNTVVVPPEPEKSNQPTLWEVMEPVVIDGVELEVGDVILERSGVPLENGIYEVTTISQEEPETIRRNIFANNDREWDYEAELSSRNPSEPYVIHIDEFVSNEMGYEQVTLTYYKGDDVMADMREKPVYDYHSKLGELRFGHGSRDQTIVYIRNEVDEVEYEVILHTGHYAIEVMGLEAEHDAQQTELRHSAVPKFRSRE